MSDLHLLQYDDGCRMSTVLCPDHRPELFDYLDRYGLGHDVVPVPKGIARCDRCEGES